MSHDDQGEPRVTTEVAPEPKSDAVPADAAGSTTAEVGDPTAAMAEVMLQTRRAVVPAVVLGVLALIVGAVLGELVAAVGVCIGLGLGMANARLLRQSVQRRFETLVNNPGTKTHFLSGGAGRLAILTGITLLALILVKPLGFGIVIGLAVFQITLLLLAGTSMFKSVRA